jgi:uncharacterized membrane protein YfcA
VIVGLLMLGSGAAAGLFGSLLGLGGGILIVPILTLGFDLPLREAVGVSLVSVIVTSGAAAGVYLERGVANLRLGMVLELFTAVGALIGGLIAFLLDERFLAGLFAALLLYVAVTMGRSRPRTPAAPNAAVPPVTVPADATPVGNSRAGPMVPGPTAAVASAAVPPPPQTVGDLVDRLSGSGYRVRNLVPGAVGGVGAGITSALLGIGGGAVLVPLMHLLMGIPLRVATATSNLMIGVTATASAIIYVLRGGIDPYVAGPTAIGVFLGATLGSRISHRIGTRALRWLFVVVLVYTAIQMIRRALGFA